MVLPAVGLPQERPQDLQGLDPLLAEPARVEGARRRREVRVREEGLRG